MKKSCFIYILICFSISSFAQTGLTKGAALLFKNCKTKLTIAEKNSLFLQTGFVLSKDQKQFATSEAEAADYPFDAYLYNTDMNADGKEEIFIVFGNSYTSGMTGSNAVLYIKDANGKYKANLGFPSTTPMMLPTKSKGYPDLVIGGPGFTFPVWRWDGKAYNFFREIKEKELLSLKSIDAAEASKAYQRTLKN